MESEFESDVGRQAEELKSFEKDREEAEKVVSAIALRLQQHETTVKLVLFHISHDPFTNFLVSVWQDPQQKEVLGRNRNPHGQRPPQSPGDSRDGRIWEVKPWLLLGGIATAIAIVSMFFWQWRPCPPNRPCIVVPPAPPPVVATPPDPQPLPAEIVLKENGLFGFAVNAIALTGEGKKTLNDVVGTLQSGKPVRILVTGHADRTGHPGSNQTLSELRANAVRAYLIQQGITTPKPEVQGAGDSEPSSQQTDHCLKLAPPERAKCFSDDRRVVIQYWIGSDSPRSEVHK